MTAAGDFIWSKSYMRPKGMVHDALVEPDGSIMVVGMTDSLNVSMFETLPGWYQPKLFMMKLNGDGEVQWCKGWRNTTFRWFPHRPARIKRTLDGQYAVLATLGMPANNLEFHPFMMKTDLSGDTLWTSTVGQIGYIYITQDLLPYSDGGYLISGIIYGDLPDNQSSAMYIFKADSLGRFGCQQEHYPMQVSDLFPVDSAFTLNYIHGTATATPVYVQDSILDPSIFTTWDACTLATDLPPRMERSRPMSVRPNPNTGRFTVHFDDPLMAESWYSVYDALGKLLYQRPWPSGKQTEEVDLSRFGRGTYVIRFTDAEGGCYQRVVVE